VEVLSSLPNISKVIESKLNDVGIQTKEQLFAIGSKDAFVRIRMKNTDTCINMLYAIEGAIEGIRWHDLSNNKKTELKDFYKTL